MRCGGILLTGGASRRFGRDKAREAIGTETLAQRSGRLLGAVTDDAVEVGPGWSGLRSVRDEAAGPLLAVSTGWSALAECDAALVLACDLPLLSEGLLGWLVAHPAEGSVVPMAGDPPQPQPLCARWSAASLDAVASRIRQGERAMRAMLGGGDVLLVAPAEWSAAAGPAGSEALADADTPAELDRLLGRRTPRP